MSHHRFFVEKIAEEVALTGDEYRHARNVLRLDVGAEVVLLDGSGAEYPAIVARAEKGALLLHVVGRTLSEREPKADVCLLAGLLKGDKTELVVQKAVELGANKIGLFRSRYCNAFFGENKMDRLQKVAREAAKQCMRARVPAIGRFDSLEEALASATPYESKLFACEFLPSRTGEIPEGRPSYCVMVGSEGGFAPEEYELAQRYGFEGISLGKRILRAETAAISLLSVVMYRAGELK